ncbi:MAG: Amidohydrolase [candidate division TA06 bacterium ADurb.Bin417]|uniref:Amidohydrolase n=1 Tax=candidate division TA06 bacterium ADurb.Bin417 TaxID=1852828 RepID=A0A1V5MCM2_UNCT6|nr:MAG: Amidohydrolase [candidate division TA06 bacterium ADurb.Bin417]
MLLPFATGEFKPEELAGAVRAKRIRAVRLFPVEHRYTLADWNCASLFDFLAEYRLPTFLELNQADWNEAARILGRYPGLPLVIAATGYRHGRILYPLLEKFSNLYLETSAYVTYEGIEDICRRFGSGRLLFGSRAPFMDLGGALARIIYAGIPAADRQAIAAGNLKRLLGVQ